MRRTHLVAAIILLAGVPPATAPLQPTTPYERTAPPRTAVSRMAVSRMAASRVDAPRDRLIPVLRAGEVWNAVTTTADGRVFVGFPHLGGGPGVRVAEAKAGRFTPYPDAAWNSWAPGHDPATAFVGFNAMRIGPDGRLWVVDAGTPGFGTAPLPGGPKIVVIDVARGQVAEIFPLDDVTGPDSHVDDIRFNGRTAYVTDAGRPGLIVLDLDTGGVRRVLGGARSTTAGRPMYADGRMLRGPGGRPARINADQLEVSPDGRHLYFQPASGPMYRVETRWLDDPWLGRKELARHVERWVDTPSTGGTAIDARGNIYLSDVDRRRILRITPQRGVTTLVRDARLQWVDAMWIDDRGYLWLPAAQLDRIPLFQGGRSRVRYPVEIFKMRIGERPPARDHGGPVSSPSPT